MNIENLEEPFVARPVPELAPSQAMVRGMGKALEDLGILPEDSIWLPGLRPLDNSGHTAAAIEGIIQTAQHWLWLAGHGLYQWLQDAEGIYEKTVLETPLPPSPDGIDEDRSDWFHTAGVGPIVELRQTFGEYMITVSQAPQGAMRVQVQDATGVHLSNTILGG